jgi:hypothetical protein
METKLIEQVLTHAYGIQITVKYSEDEQEYRAYYPHLDMDNEDYDTFEVIFFKTGEVWRIGYFEYNQGVWMRSDGSGEPPSWDDVEVNQDFKTIAQAVEYWARFKFNEAMMEAFGSLHPNFQ